VITKANLLTPLIRSEILSFNLFFHRRWPDCSSSLHRICC